MIAFAKDSAESPINALWAVAGSRNSSAIGVAATYVLLANASDGVVLVLKANSSRRESAQRALKELKGANIAVFGAVLNQRTFPIPNRIYHWL